MKLLSEEKELDEIEAWLRRFRTDSQMKTWYLPRAVATIRVLKKDNDLFSAEFFAATKRYELLEKRIKELKAALERLTKLASESLPVAQGGVSARLDWELGVDAGRREAAEIAQAALRGEEVPDAP